MRRHRAKKREVAVDPSREDEVMARFINALMWKGKKSIARKLFFDALGRAAVQGKSSRELFHEALGNVKPALEIRSRRVGGATYPVPVQVRPERAQALGIRWIIDSARKRSEKTMCERLAAEFKGALSQQGGAVEKCRNTLKMAEANRAFAHYRW